MYYYYAHVGKASEKRTALAGLTAAQFRQFLRDCALPDRTVRCCSHRRCRAMRFAE